jgi:hypothetical protein
MHYVQQNITAPSVYIRWCGYFIYLLYIMSFNYTNDTGNKVDIYNIFQAGTGVMTRYKVNGNVLTFLPPFTFSTDAHGSNSTYAAKIPYSNGGTQFEFCPKYRLHAGRAYYTSQSEFDNFTAVTDTSSNTSFSNRTIPAGVKRMLAVCIGAGGGGGGGGAESGSSSGGNADAGGGAGGGGGAMVSKMFDIVSGVNTYSCSIGSGGIYGQPNNRTSGLLKPGKEDINGNLANGRPGGDGGYTIFTYNGIDISANGGGGGEGGKSNSEEGGGATTANGGAGGSVPGSTPLQKAGTDGASVSNQALANDITIPGGIGGKCGNLNTTDITGVFVNVDYISFESSQWTNTGSNATNTDPVTSTSNEVNAFNLKFGEGGHGGMGDDDGAHYGFAGEVGAPGCVIVFFYYT